MKVTDQEQPGAEPSQKHRDAFALVVGRTMDALAQDPRALDAALKADPVRGAVEFGSKALWTVTDAAERAGRPMPFEVVVASGVQVIKALGAIANEKGYLPDDAIEGFLTQAYQQAIGRFAKLDADAGKLDAKGMEVLKRTFGGRAEEMGEPADSPAEEVGEPAHGALAAAGRRVLQ